MRQMRIALLSFTLIRSPQQVEQSKNACKPNAHSGDRLSGKFPCGIMAPLRGLTLLVSLAMLSWSTAWASISDDEIRVGLLVDMHSIFSHITGDGSVIAAQMAIEDVGGRVAGMPIRLVHVYHANSVERVSQIARRWLYKDGIDVIADVAGSPLAIAVQEINRERGAVIF